MNRKPIAAVVLAFGLASAGALAGDLMSKDAYKAEKDRIKAGDWHVLRSYYPDLYAKAFREANLIIERKRKTKR